MWGICSGFYQANYKVRKCSMRYIYFVDCENVGTTRLSGKPRGSLIFYFTSGRSRMGGLAESEREVKVQHRRQKNALDFVLDTYLGFMMSRFGKSVKYVIVSNDKGFDLVAKFWGIGGSM